MPQPHCHDHQEHTHASTVNSENERKVLVSFALIFGFMFVEVIGGLISGSLALIADAGHMLTDAAALALALAYSAFRLGKRAADSKRAFGYMRTEILNSSNQAGELLILGSPNVSIRSPTDTASGMAHDQQGHG